ncbi:hypothetical protein NDU88_005137 [Pleurodeles waltl]|uniref:Uncharacterized protein n=1 Tax=Pleurodeles waltl TaxID=8319 RepID=A0AAV7MG03_PLEWA|nr:hypothetical protein NDU88_005137 [Pleurodeles waltl]
MCRRGDDAAVIDGVIFINGSADRQIFYIDGSLNGVAGADGGEEAGLLREGDGSASSLLLDLSTLASLQSNIAL